MDNLPVFKKEHAYDILHMVKDAFEDFDIENECDDSLEEFYEDSSEYDLDHEFGGDYTDDESDDDSLIFSHSFFALLAPKIQPSKGHFESAITAHW